MSRARSTVGGTVRSVGPDAIHLCLTVGERPHLFGCAWASYGEACLPGPRTAARRCRGAGASRARRLSPAAGPSRGGDGGRSRGPG